MEEMRHQDDGAQERKQDSCGDDHFLPAPDSKPPRLEHLGFRGGV
jgi:hypothetical protein